MRRFLKLASIATMNGQNAQFGLKIEIAQNIPEQFYKHLRDVLRKNLFTETPDIRKTKGILKLAKMATMQGL